MVLDAALVRAVLDEINGLTADQVREVIGGAKTKTLTANADAVIVAADGAALGFECDAEFKEAPALRRMWSALPPWARTLFWATVVDLTADGAKEALKVAVQNVASMVAAAQMAAAPAPTITGDVMGVPSQPQIEQCQPAPDSPLPPPLGPLADWKKT